MSSFDIVSKVLQFHGVPEEEIIHGSAEQSSADERPFSSIVNYAAKETGLDPDLIHAVIKAESNYNPKAVSPRGAMGLMQLMPKTAEELGVTNPHDPQENILAGARYLGKLIEENGGSVEKGLWAYNAGQKRVQQGIMPMETERYISRIMGIMGGEDPFASYDEKRGLVPADEVVRRVILQRMQPKPTIPEVISSRTPGLLEKLGGLLTDSQTAKDKAAMDLALAQQYGLAPSRIEQDKEFRDALIRETFSARDVDEPTYYKSLMNAAILSGILPVPTASGALSSHIWPTMKAIAGFTGLGELESAVISAATGQPYEFLNQRGLSELLPEGAGKNVTAITEAIDFIAKGAALGFAGRKLGARWEKLSEPYKEKYLREQMESIAPGATIEIPANRLRDYFTRGGKTHDAEFYNMMQDIGIPEGQARNAVLNGLTIELPATKLVKVADKPWWGKLKQALDIDPYARITAEHIGPARARVSEVRGKRLMEPEPQVIHPLRDEVFPEAPLAPEAQFTLKGEPYSKDFILKQREQLSPENKAKLDELLLRRGMVEGPAGRKLIEGPEAEVGRKLSAQGKAYEEGLAASVGRVQPTSAERLQIRRLMAAGKKKEAEKLAMWIAAGGSARKGIQDRISDERFHEGVREALGSLPEVSVPLPQKETLSVVKKIISKKPPEVSRETAPAPAPKAVTEKKKKTVKAPIKANKESVYRGDNLKGLMDAAEKEQRERWELIESLRNAIEKKTISKKNMERAETELNSLIHLYEAAYEEIRNAGGDPDAIRAKVEKAEKKTVSDMTSRELEQEVKHLEQLAESRYAAMKEKAGKTISYGTSFIDQKLTADELARWNELTTELAVRKRKEEGGAEAAKERVKEKRAIKSQVENKMIDGPEKEAKEKEEASGGISVKKEVRKLAAKGEEKAAVKKVKDKEVKPGTAFPSKKKFQSEQIFNSIVAASERSKLKGKVFSRAELNELAKLRFGKTFDEMSPAQRRKLSQDEYIQSTDVSLREIIAMGGSYNPKKRWDENRGLASPKSGEYVSDGHWLIIDKDIAEEFRNKYWDELLKSWVKDRRRLPAYSDTSYDELLQMGKEWIDSEQKEYHVPDYAAVVPKAAGEPVEYVGAVFNDLHPYAVFAHKDGSKVYINSTYLGVIAKHFPDATMSQVPAKGLSPVQFRVNGEIKAIVMPVKFDNLTIMSNEPAGSMEKYAARTPWTDRTAKAVIHTGYNKMRSHRDYAAAKSGDTKAAANLVMDLMNADKIRALAMAYEGRNVVVYPVNAIEAGGINQIPLAMAAHISGLTGWHVNTDVIQTNVVHHTGATAMERLMRQPEFAGKPTGELAIIVDDVSTTGSTLAGLKGYLENNGVTVIGIHALSQGTFGSNLRISVDTLNKLKENFGHELPAVLETIYKEKVPPEGLTESEARTINANRDALIERTRAGEAAPAPERGLERAEGILEETRREPAVDYRQAELPGLIDPIDKLLDDILGILDRNPTQHSLAESEDSVRKSIRAAFPNAEIGPTEIIETEQGQRYAFFVTSPNGSRILVDWKNKIIINPAAYKSATGEELKPGIVAAASWRQIGPHGVLTYTDLASPADMHHEAFHAAWDIVMTDEERKLLEDEFGSEEKAAEDYGNWAHEQAGKRERKERGRWLHSLYQRIRNFFQRLKEFFFPSFRTVYDKVSTGKIWERVPRREATQAGKTIFRDAADYAIRNFSGEKEVSVPTITEAIMASRPVTKAMVVDFVRLAKRAGVSDAGIRKAVEKFQQYNEIRRIGNFAILPKIEPTAVVIREGVLNTPAVSGFRRERLDKALYPAIKEGKSSAQTGKLIEGGAERTAIPKDIRGLEPNVFLNLPITQPDLSHPRPPSLKYPLIVTGNPHLTNFKRPDPSWDSVIKVVRVKPVLGGSPAVTKAVAKAINYAREIGAHVLITTYRAKHHWSLARFTDFVPTDPKDPAFNDLWIPNPRPRGEDPRKWVDWTPWVPRDPNAMRALFRANGWDTAKQIYGPSSYNVMITEAGKRKGLKSFKTKAEAQAYLETLPQDMRPWINERGGTWWWPTSRQLDPSVLDLIEPGPIEYSDLFHEGCPSCRNCQQLTYPDAAGAPIVGITDEPFCEMGCPQCFVRLGNSGIHGRKGISLGQNAKQAGFGKSDIGDYYSQSVQILKGVARPSSSGLVDVSASFLRKSPAEQIDTATSLLVSGAIKPKEHVTIVDEVLRATSDGLLELDPPAKYATRRPPQAGAPLSGISILKAWHRVKNGITFAPHKDISIIEELWHNPWFLSKKPGEEDIARLVRIELDRNKARTRATHEDLEAVTPVFALRGKALDLLTELIWKLDGKQLKGVTSSRFIWGKNAEGRPGIRALNQDHYDQMTSALENSKYKGIADVYVTLRKGLDRSLAKAFNAQSRMKDIEDSTIDKLRKSIGQIPNYFPHVRYGNWSIRGYDADGKIVYRSHYYDTPKVSVRGEHLLARIKPKYPNAVEWKIAPVTKLPDEIYDFPIPIEAMEQIIYAAAERVGDPAARQLFEKAMPEAVADVIKSRGWGAHMIKRRDIPGHEQRDIKRILHEYFAGLNGWLTKMEASRKHSEVLRDLRAKREPRRWKYATDYVRDVLSNADRLDAAADTLRTLIYVKYLAGVIKSGVVNLSQNVVAAVPRMSIDAHFAGTKYLSAAYKSIVGAITKGRNLSENEMKLITDLVLDGVASDQFNQEIKGHIGTRIGNTLNRAVDVLGLTMALPERFNRISTGLAAYRLARDGKIINPDTLTRYGMEKRKPWPYDKAKAYAEEIINDTHFVMGKSNLPTWARGPSVGAKAGRSAYALQSFSHQYLQLLGWMSKQRRGYRAIFRSLLALMILGGISSMPFFGTTSRLSRRLFGRDPDSAVREMVPESTGPNRNLWRDLVVYGAPSALGVDLSGSLSIEFHNPDNPVASLVGVPYSILIDDPLKAMDAYQYGQPARAAESIVPRFVANVLSAKRQYEEGTYTITGRPLALPGESEARKLTAAEAVAKAAGFQPLSSSKAWDIQEKVEDMTKFVAAKRAKWASRYANAQRDGNQKEMTAVRNEVEAWNARVVSEGRPQLQVNLAGALRERGRPRQPSRPMRGAANELKGLYE